MRGSGRNLPQISDKVPSTLASWSHADAGIIEGTHLHSKSVVLTLTALLLY